MLMRIWKRRGMFLWITSIVDIIRNMVNLYIQFVLCCYLTTISVYYKSSTVHWLKKFISEREWQMFIKYSFNNLGKMFLNLKNAVAIHIRKGSDPQHWLSKYMCMYCMKHWKCQHGTNPLDKTKHKKYYFSVNNSVPVVFNF